MKIDHVAIYTKNLDRLKAFYEYYFGGISNTKYKNKSYNILLLNNIKIFL